MAKGKYGYGSSSSSGCEYCNEPLLLSGDDWKNGKQDALFALQCIAVIVVLICGGLMARFKWTRPNGNRDTGRTTAYGIAVVSALIYFILGLVDTGLREAETETVYLYKIIYIFSSLFWRICEILVLWVVLKTVISGTSSGIARVLKILSAIAIAIVSALTIAGFGMITAIYAYQIKNGPYDDHDSLYKNQNQVGLAYESLYLVTVIFAAVLGFIVLIKDRSLATLLLAVIVIPALFLRILMDLVYTAYSYTVTYGDSYYSYRNSYSTLLNLSWADGYIYVIMTIVIFLGLAIIAIRRPRIASTTAYGDQHQKVEYGTAGYNSAYPAAGNVGYAQPGYGNPTNAPHVYN